MSKKMSEHFKQKYSVVQIFVTLVHNFQVVDSYNLHLLIKQHKLLTTVLDLTPFILQIEL